MQTTSIKRATHLSALHAKLVEPDDGTWPGCGWHHNKKGEKLVSEGFEFSGNCWHITNLDFGPKKLIFKFY